MRTVRILPLMVLPALLFTGVAIAGEPSPDAARVTLPKKTPVEMEILENLNSKINRTGDRVRFRVAEDVVVDGRVVFARDTMLVGRIKFAQPSKSNGREGTLQVVVPKIPATDGREIAMFSEIVATGRQRSGSAGMASIMGGVAFLTMRGRQAYYSKGEIFEVVSRAEEIVDTVPVEEAVRELPAGTREAVRSNDVAVISYNPNKGNIDQTVTLRFPASAGVPAKAEIRYVDDFEIATPVAALKLRKSGSHWLATFNGWSVARHLMIREDGKPNTLYLELQMPGSRTSWAVAGARLKVK